MSNINEQGLVELSMHEIRKTEGGLLILSKEFFHWAYTEFKKGLDDGYNNR